jgi:hypothetical protein
MIGAHIARNGVADALAAIDQKELVRWRMMT